MKKIAILQIASEYYALDILRVNTIKNYEKPNRIPNNKPFIKGVINLRGQIVPILDLREILGYAEGGDESKKKIIIIENDEELVGLIIDEVVSISDISDDDVQDLESIRVNDFSDVIESVVKFDDKLVAMLSISKILEK